MRGTVKNTRQPEYKKLLAALIAARKKSGVTQQELAKLLKKPQSFISKYESGERRLDVIELVKIAEILGVNYKTIVDKALF
jgi:transcriptional regulator with XRE-family HTH domain